MDTHYGYVIVYVAVYHMTMHMVGSCTSALKILHMVGSCTSEKNLHKNPKVALWKCRGGGSHEFQFLLRSGYCCIVDGIALWTVLTIHCQSGPGPAGSRCESMLNVTLRLA